MEYIERYCVKLGNMYLGPNNTLASDIMLAVGWKKIDNAKDRIEQLGIGNVVKKILKLDRVEEL